MPRRAPPRNALRRARVNRKVEFRERAVAEISVLQNGDGLWAVTAQGLVVTGLTKEGAEAFAASFLRLGDQQPAQKS